MKKLLVIALTCSVAFAGALGCEKVQLGGDETKQETPMATPEQTMPDKSISAATVVVGDKSWTVEIAASDAERMKGLGGRDALAAKSGMWFIFPADAQDPFWMKDTNFDLDMIFVGPDMKIVDVKSGNVKLTESLVQPQAPYRYVLETNAGESLGLKAGDVVEYRLGPK